MCVRVCVCVCVCVWGGLENSNGPYGNVRRDVALLDPVSNPLRCLYLSPFSDARFLSPFPFLVSACPRLMMLPVSRFCRLFDYLLAET